MNADPMQKTILVVDDDPDLLRLIAMRLTAAGYAVSTAESGERALAAGRASTRPQLVVTDLRMGGMDGMALFEAIHRESHPSLPVIILTAHGTIPDAVTATRRGVFGYLTKPFERQGAARHRSSARCDALAARRRGAAARRGLARGDHHAQSRAWRTCCRRRGWWPRATRACCIFGASGTGKELLARAIHRASPRARAPFVAINCGAIPEALLESELFGHVKGSFTGAVARPPGPVPGGDRAARCSSTRSATCRSPLQVKLLRVLQERKVRPVGSHRALRRRRARDLGDAPQPRGARWRAGEFREDLYYRLNVVTLYAPDARRAARGHPAARQPFPDARSPSATRKHGVALRARGDGAAGLGALAGQRAPALQRGRAGGRARDHAESSRSRSSQQALQSQQAELDARSTRRGARFERDYLVRILQDHRRQRHQGRAPRAGATAPSSTSCSSATRSSRGCSRARSASAAR